MQLRPGSYEAWRVREEEFPRSGPLAEQLRFLVRYAVLAPSAHNTQPWVFSVHENHLRVHLDESRALTVSDPTRREMMVSLGACVGNLLVAAEHFGFRASIEEFPLSAEHTVADLALVADESVRTPEGDRLFAAIPNRRSNRHLYDGKKVPADLLMKFRVFAASGDPKLDLVEDPEKIRVLADLTGQATAVSMADPSFRAELSRWVRSNYTTAPDGMPGFAVGIPDVPSLLGPFMVKLPPTARAEAKKRRAQVASSPVVGIIRTKGNDRREWFRAGLVLEHVWLAATAEGLAMAVLAAVIETGEFFREVGAIVGGEFRPQVLFRVGYGPNDLHPTPRRPLGDVLR